MNILKKCKKINQNKKFNSKNILLLDNNDFLKKYKYKKNQYFIQLNENTILKVLKEDENNNFNNSFLKLNKHFYKTFLKYFLNHLYEKKIYIIKGLVINYKNFFIKKKLKKIYVYIGVLGLIIKVPIQCFVSLNFKKLFIKILKKVLKKKNKKKKINEKIKKAFYFYKKTLNKKIAKYIFTHLNLYINLKKKKQTFKIKLSRKDYLKKLYILQKNKINKKNATIRSILLS